MIIVKFIHLMSLVTWIGGMLFFSFLAAPSIFKVLPRETAGKVVGDLFPKYWMMGYIGSLLSLLTLVIASYHKVPFPWIRSGMLTAMVFLSFYSGLVIGKKARDIKAEISVVHEGVEKTELQQEFRKYHAQSTIVNVIIMIVGIFVIYMTASAPL